MALATGIIVQRCPMQNRRLAPSGTYFGTLTDAFEPRGRKLTLSKRSSLETASGTLAVCQLVHQVTARGDAYCFQAAVTPNSYKTHKSKSY
jgi:hypothetical protein